MYAQDNNVFAVLADQSGYNGHSTHLGGAYVLAPDGRVLAVSQPSPDDQLVTARLEADLRRKGQNSIHCTLKMRRPELYGELTRML